MASVGGDTSRINAALSSTGFSSSPVDERAVSVVGAFDAATSVKVAVRSTIIQTLTIIGTVIYTDVRLSIAVRLVSNFTTVRGATALSSCSASVATTIGTTVGSGSRAVGIDSTRSASSIALTTWLTGNMTSIENTTISVSHASLAAAIGLAVVSTGVRLAVSIVIDVVLLANIRITTNSISSADGVSSHWERSVVGNAIGIGNASNATTIFHAILVTVAISVTSTTR